MYDGERRRHVQLAAVCGDHMRSVQTRRRGGGGGGGGPHYMGMILHFDVIVVAAAVQNISFALS